MTVCQYCGLTGTEIAALPISEPCPASDREHRLVDDGCVTDFPGPFTEATDLALGAFDTGIDDLPGDTGKVQS